MLAALILGATMKARSSRRFLAMTTRGVQNAMSRIDSRLQDTAAFGSEIESSFAAHTLANWLRQRSRPVVALTGAGMSTKSGIPDYRGLNGSYRLGHKPMSNDEFMTNEANRQRYWARALQGYAAFASAQPNAAHRALADMQRAGMVSLVATQNVDGLHEAAAGGLVVALHGRGDRVVCMSCGRTGCRSAYHQELEYLNPTFAARETTAKEIRPDADAEVDFDPITIQKFIVAPCSACGGIIKPDVVFFGDSVPRSRVDTVMNALDTSDGLLCLGTSLAVYSAFRFVDRAAKASRSVCVVNRGPTRADLERVALMKLDTDVGVLENVVTILNEAKPRPTSHVSG